jgi:hypothetical protein
MAFMTFVTSAFAPENGRKDVQRDFSERQNIPEKRRQLKKSIVAKPMRVLPAEC